MNEKTDKVEEFFRTVDAQIDFFKTTTKIDCIPGCGHCCENPRVCATVLEFFPLARFIYREKREEEVWEKLSKNSEVCIFFQKQGQGCCSVYPYRGLICRLFGFSLRKEKTGKISPLTCRMLQEKFSPTVELQLLPIMSECAYNFLDIDPALATIQHPINTAIARAMQRWSFFQCAST
jgi:Fe-S-cluster containining protein